MNLDWEFPSATALAIIAALLVPLVAPAQAPPDNLALHAEATASSQFNARYGARFATDGIVPVAGSRADVGRAWCVKGAKVGGQATFRLRWNRPVKVAEIVYFGRTAWMLTECFKDYEVYLDSAALAACDVCRDTQ